MATLQPEPGATMDRAALELLLADVRAYAAALERRLAALGSRERHLHLVAPD